jgi:hypothetical protein
VSRELVVRGIGERDHVIRSVQHGEEGRRALEHVRQPRALHLQLGEQPVALALQRARAHLLGGLEAVHQRAPHHALLHDHGAVGEGEERLLHLTEAHDLQAPVLEVHGLAAHHALEQRPDVALDLRPRPQHRLAECRRMLVAEDHAVGVVVDLEQVRSPADRLRDPLAHHHRRRRPEALRPPRHRTERRGRPVHGAAEPSHLARDGKELHGGVRRGARGRRPPHLPHG